MLVARIEVLGEVDARGAIRFHVDSDSVVRGMNGVPVSVRVENFSRTGILFHGDVDLPEGTLISIGLSGAGAREAKVVWRDGDAHGCEFLMPIARRDMARAFRGQGEVLAELRAALARGTAVEPPPEPPLPPRPGRRIRWWSRRRR
ncbi:PilZ domain-containing protein [Sphingomonas canadensis]|uniref:PilZ domain-containing protein n=1 Tax=Sphingomonas canadensis TaxID=1219257 RepID=A0ABW3H7G8_9SPHN|nr:PilZ domain-containing protein [Sphingomonas canadensis]MCW3836522.1 PilZ domain-containing protein [Sphingomonas canadensis]